MMHGQKNIKLISKLPTRLPKITYNQEMYSELCTPLEYPHVCHISDPFTPNVKVDVFIGFRLKHIIKVEQIKLGSRASQATSLTPMFNGSAAPPRRYVISSNILLFHRAVITLILSLVLPHFPSFTAFITLFPSLFSIFFVLYRNVFFSFSRFLFIFLFHFSVILFLFFSSFIFSHCTFRTQ